jgi:hypothetical protein
VGFGNLLHWVRWEANESDGRSAKPAKAASNVDGLLRAMKAHEVLRRLRGAKECAEVLALSLAFNAPHRIDAGGEVI